MLFLLIPGQLSGNSSNYTLSNQILEIEDNLPFANLPSEIKAGGEVVKNNNKLMVDIEKYSEMKSPSIDEYSIENWDAISDKFSSFDYPNDVSVAISEDESIRMIFKLTNEFSYLNLENILTIFDAEFIEYLASSNILVVNIPIKKLDSISNSLIFQIPFTGTNVVSYIEPDFVIGTQFTPNDLNWTDQWGPQKIGVETAWNTQLGNQSIKVAVLDTGIDYNHIDLQDNYLNIGYDYVNSDSDPMDDNGHGTHVAGTIAAGINNGIGVAGVANVSIFSQKILDAQGSGFYSWAIEAIYNATDLGANILSNSWSGSAYSSSLQDAVTYAVDNGALFIAAAGNDGSISPQYPAALEGAISVAATDEFDVLAPFSNLGSTIDISAPGVNILSTMPGNSYGYLSGTSMATPHVSGLAALLWSQYPNYSSDQIENLIYFSSIDLGDFGYDTQFGWGRIDASQGINGLPNEDLSIKVEQVGYQEFDETFFYNVTVENTGLAKAYSILFDIYVDNTSQQFTIDSLNSGESIKFSYSEINKFDIINITAYVHLLTNEIFDRNNGQTIMLKSFLFSNVKDFDQISGGSVFIDPKLHDPTQLAEFELYLNGGYLSRSVGLGVTDEKLYFPVFNNGTNNLKIVAYWYDGSFFEKSIGIESFNVIPMVNVQIGDYLTWTWDNSDGSYQDQTWTFVEWISPIKVNTTIYVRDYDGVGTIWDDTFWGIVNVLNGYFEVTNFGWDGQRFSYLNDINLLNSNYGANNFAPGWFDWNSIISLKDRVITQGNNDIVRGDINGNIIEINVGSGATQNYKSGFLNNTSILPNAKGLSVKLDVIQDFDLPGEDIQISIWINNFGDFGYPNITVTILVNDLIINNLLVNNSYSHSILLTDTQYATSAEMLDTLVNITVSVSTMSDNSISDSSTFVLDMRDDGPPVLLRSPNDLIYSYGDPNIFASWVFKDKFPLNYVIKMDGIEVISDVWRSEIPISYALDGLSLGEYEFEIIVYDRLQNFNSDKIIISVVDPQASSISGTTRISQTVQNSTQSDTNIEEPQIKLPGFTLLVSAVSLIFIPIARKRKSFTH